ncbi:MAG: fused MFS/spermidine synthase, partial [Thermoanaerobaculia bacterium]
MRTREKSIFLGLFFLSGACGLTYEIVWSRLLVFVFGGTTFAITTVLTCFMGGLALGSWLAGRMSGRRLFARPARLYGILEIFIGLAALLVPVLMEWSTGLYRILEHHLGHSFLLLSVARVTVSAAILLLPTAAMGATLPLLASAFTRRRTQIGGDVAALYGANTFGAFVGCAGAGFFLLPQLGLSGSIRTAAAVNLAAGAVALLMSLRPESEPREVAAEEADAGRQDRKGKARTLLLLYGLSGFAAMAYQVAWTRALILSMGSSTYSFSTIVSCYIFGLAAGSLVMTRWVDKVRRPLSLAGLLQTAIALSALFVVPLFGKLPDVVAHATASPEASFGSVLFLEAAWAFGLLIVPTFCMGALLPLVCRIYDPSPERAGRSVGDVYAANTAGTILGAALAGFVLIPLSSVGMERTIHIASILNLVVGSWFLLAQTPGKIRRYALAAGAWLVAALTVGVTEPWSRELMTSGPYLGRTPGGSGWDLVFYREGIDATVSVERSEEGHLSLSVNGKADASTLDDDMLTQSLVGVLPMLQRPDAREVCLIGLGSGVTAGAILTFDADRLDVAEISRAVVDASRLFDDVAGAPLDDPRSRLYRADGRNFLLLGEPQSYDVIVSEPSNPWISGIANLFTREFFELSRSRLVPGGVHAQWLHGYSMDPANFAAVL